MDTIKDAQERSKKWPDSYERWLYGPEGDSKTLSSPPGTLLGVGEDRLPQSVTKPSGPATLLIDIECSPNLAYVWDVWNQNINPKMLVETKEILCFAWQWLDSGDIFFKSQYHHGKDVMLKELWNLLDKASVVIDYNGTRFDIPHINQDLLIAGYNPPSPFKHIDLFKTVKKKFNFTYMSLDHVCSQLGLRTKGDDGGFGTWLGCMRGDEKAWDKLVEYNMGDIPPMKDLYLRLRPWISAHPSIAALTGKWCCPNCGSKSLQKRGKAHTQVSTYQRYRCNDCGAWSRASKRDSGIEIRQEA